MKGNYHLMLDFETMGTSVFHNPILDMSYAVFDWNRFMDKPYSFDELIHNVVERQKFSLADQVGKYTYKKVDADFWKTVNPKARNKVIPSPEDKPLKQIYVDFLKFLREQPKIDYYWTRSTNFDAALLDRIFYDVGEIDLLREYLRFWRGRDVRTFIDAKFDFGQKLGFCPIKDEKKWDTMFIEHISTHDVAADIMRLQAITRAENDMEMVNE